jgi:hypothetical protein
MGFHFPGSLGELAHNKPAMIGLAGAGGLGLFVWYRHRAASGGNSGTGQAAGAGQVSQGYSGGLGGTLDSTGTDLASYLGDFSAGLSNQLNDWLNQAKQQLVPPPETSPSPPWSGGAITSVDDGTVVGGRNVQGYFEAWNRHNPSLHLTWQKFVQLNPGVAKNIDTFGNSSGADDAFIGNAKYRLQ